MHEESLHLTTKHSKSLHLRFTTCTHPQKKSWIYKSHFLYRLLINLRLQTHTLNLKMNINKKIIINSVSFYVNEDRFCFLKHSCKDKLFVGFALTTVWSDGLHQPIELTPSDFAWGVETPLILLFLQGVQMVVYNVGSCDNGS